MMRSAILVEDLPTIRENLIEILKELADVEVIGMAASEQEAISLLAELDADWHLVIVDLFLEEGSGLGVLQSCSPRKGYQRAVVLSNYATAMMRERCQLLGADAVFDKSTEIDAFLEYCRTC